MNPIRFKQLQQIEIVKPCPEDWDKMTGNDQKRFCDGCGCYVHNISEMNASDAETLLSSQTKTCTRILVDSNKGVLTRDGWIPRFALAGVLAASAAGCSDEPKALTGSVAPPSSYSPTTNSTNSAPRTDQPAEDKGNQNETLGWSNTIAEKPSNPKKVKLTKVGETSTYFMGDTSLVTLLENEKKTEARKK